MISIPVNLPSEQGENKNEDKDIKRNRLTIPWEIIYVQNIKFDKIYRSSEVVL